MELPDFLKKFADPGLRDEAPRSSSYRASIVTDEEVAVIMAPGRAAQSSSTWRRAGRAGRPADRRRRRKSRRWAAPSDAAERTTAVDMLGSKRQLVFATHSVASAILAQFQDRTEAQVRRRAGAQSPHGRAFCAGDARLSGWPSFRLDEPDLALAELDFAFEAGLKAIWVPHWPCGEQVTRPRRLRSLLAASGGERHPLRPPRRRLAASARQGMDQQRPRAHTRLDGRRRESCAPRTPPPSIRGSSETFILWMMVIDGVFERFPAAARGQSVELGAGWVPSSLLTRLDRVAKHWSRVDQNSSPASPARRRASLPTRWPFTPFVFAEDVGELIEESNPDLYMFSSDYPHTEGGRNPIARFEASLGDRPEAIRERFPRRELPAHLSRRAGRLSHGRAASGLFRRPCMCSWCWGFAPVIEAVALAYGFRLPGARGHGRPSPWNHHACMPQKARG